MRISDWSSDVCSFDLGITGDALVDSIAEMEADLATLGVMGAAAGGRVYSANPDSVRKRLYRWRRSGQMGLMSHDVPDVPPVSHGVEAAAGTEKPRNAEIGRASCRERVCQYV